MLGAPPGGNTAKWPILAEVEPDLHDASAGVFARLAVNEKEQYMSLKTILVGASALAVFATTMPAARADQTTTVFGGGGTLAAKLYRDLFNCYSASAYAIFATSLDNPSNVTYPTSQNAACTTEAAHPVAVAYEPVGSGAGQAAFTTGMPVSFGTPATTNSVAYLNGSATVAASVTPYPEVEFAGSDAYLTPDQISEANAVDNGTPIFAIPTVATPITLPIGQVSGKKLLISDVCKIFSGQEIIKGNTAATQQIYVRLDGSGTSFIFSEFLADNCPTTAGYAFTSANGFPSTAPNWTAAQVGTLATITAVSGSGGIASAVAAASYSIGYVSPDYVQPIVTSRAAYPAEVGLTAAKEVAPSVANTQKHVTATTSASSYPTTYSNNIGAQLNDLLAASTYAGSGYPIVGYTFIYTYGCYSSSFDGGLIGTKAKGVDLKTALQALIPNAGAHETTLQVEAAKIITASGFSPVTYNVNSTVAALLYSTNASAPGPLSANGINGTNSTCLASRPN